MAEGVALSPQLLAFGPAGVHAGVGVMPRVGVPDGVGEGTVGVVVGDGTDVGVADGVPSASRRASQKGWRLQTGSA